MAYLPLPALRKQILTIPMNRVKPDEIECSGIECSGIECSGIECSGIETIMKFSL